jgi:hypothetical protein
MKRISTTFLAILFCAGFAIGQSTSLRVYEILQDNCASCHNHADPAAGLDLEGAGTTISQKAFDVYQNIADVTPANAHAAAAGYKYIYPGRPDQSFLFRKINQGLEPTIQLEAAEEAPMPKDNDPLSDVEKELIRQWILFGAPLDNEVVDEQLLVDYYDNGMGTASFETPPAAPSPGEGFQIKMGPFFLSPAGNPGDEVEYFQKYELKLPEDVEVNRLDVKISGYSHHFILYDFDSPFYANAVDHGYRIDPYHNGVGLVAAIQEATDLVLPEGTAFAWDDDLVLDMNSHYINYDAATVYQAEVYVNVYTQPLGTAAQEMHTELITNTDIYIDNDGDEVIYADVVNYNLGEVYLWGIMGHTHQYGTSYKVFRRENGEITDLIYDASCAEGVPGCISPYFDYQHIPMRYFDQLQPLTMNWANGFVHEASWVNDGPSPVWFGPTSSDEMMVLVIMYTEGSEGVIIADAKETKAELDPVVMSPNPISTEGTLQLPASGAPFHIQITDALGRVVMQLEDIRDQQVTIPRRNLPAGLYRYRIENTEGQFYTGSFAAQ